MRTTLRQMADSGLLNAQAAPIKKPMAPKPPQPEQDEDQVPTQKFPLPTGPGLQELHVHLHPPDAGDDDVDQDPSDQEQDGQDPSDMEQDGDGQAPNGKQTPGSPLAQSIALHMQDPLGATKKTFGNLTKTKLAYQQAQEEAKRQVIPAMSVLQHVSNAHNLQPAMPGMDPNNPDQSMGYDPQTGQPQNMNQQPGAQQMNDPQNARMGVGTSPRLNPRIPTPGNAGTASQTQVRPPKMGVPQPGQSKPGTAAGNPGKKPAVGKKSQGKSIKLEVKSASDLGVRSGRRQIEAAAAWASLRFTR